MLNNEIFRDVILILMGFAITSRGYDILFNISPGKTYFGVIFLTVGIIGTIVMFKTLMDDIRKWKIGELNDE